MLDHVKVVAHLEVVVVLKVVVVHLKAVGCSVVHPLGRFKFVAALNDNYLLFTPHPYQKLSVNLHKKHPRIIAAAAVAAG